MIATPLTQLFDRVRTRFGLDIEVVDGALTSIYPSGETEFRRAVEARPDVRSGLSAALGSGRSAQVRVDAAIYDCLPLRTAQRTPGGPAMVAVRRAPADAAWPSSVWADFAKTMLETIGLTEDAIAVERERARKLLGTIRFLGYLVETEDERALAQTLLQAAAIWFDVDAQVYRRDLAGDLILYASLPGAVVDEAWHRLHAGSVKELSDPFRPGAVGSTAQSAAGPLLIPLGDGDDTPLVLALFGGASEEARMHLSVIGCIAGAHAELARAQARDRVRERLHGFVHTVGVAPDVIADHVVRELLRLTSAGSAALTLNERGRTRRLVSLGAAAPEVVAMMSSTGDWLFAPEQFVCAFPLTEGVTATLEMRPERDTVFSPEAAAIVRVGAEILRTWLRGTAVALGDAAAAGEVDKAASAFVGRIEEELQRARRFDLRLSLVVVDLPPQLGAADRARLLDTVRRELRGSDVLGHVEGSRLAALLTHTDAGGSSSVVERLRRRLGSAAARPTNGAHVSLGHAVFSPDCKSAKALLAQAVRAAAPVPAMAAGQ